MNGMFMNLGATTLDVSGFDTSNVTDMAVMFSGCRDLASLDVSNFDTSKVTDMAGMFAYCKSLASLDVSNFDTSQVTNMGNYYTNTDSEGMFIGCSALTSLDLSNFDTSNVTRMGALFQGCTSLVSLDISGFDTSKVEKADEAFGKCTALASVKVGPKTLANLELPSTEVKGHADWYSKAAGKWFTSAQVSAERKAIADTYVKTASSYKPIEFPEVPVAPGATITIRFDGPFDLFVELVIDGKVIAEGKYTAKSGSTIVEIPATEAVGLGVGKHEIVARYSDGGTAMAAVEVAQPKPDNPGTTDPGTTDPKPDDGDEPGTADPEPVGTQAMYRLYNPNSGEHFYTASTVERDSVIAAGWNDEGIGWTAPTEGIQVYRLYNSYAGEHHYTTSAEERDMLVSVGWTWEEGGWFSDVNQAVPLYRAYNPNAFANNHHYTTDWGEFVTLLDLGWQDEGIGWYGVN
jgi:surface protein